MPNLHFRIITDDHGCGAISFHVDHEGAFLFIWPFELALLWPGVES